MEIVNPLLIGNPVNYWILRIALFVILIFCGWGVSYKTNTNRQYWLWTAPIILSYSLFFGLRYGRGADYFHYYQDLVSTPFTDYSEPLYLLWIDIFKVTDLPYYLGFVFYSFLLILGVALMVKHCQKAAIWVYPIFVLLTPSSENLIRQYFAAAFILIAVAAYYNGKLKWAIVYALVALNIHFSSFFIIGVCLVAKYVKASRKVNLILPILLVVIYLFTYFLWDNSYFGWVADILSKISLSEDTAGAAYLENADRWFTDEGDLNVIMGRTVGVQSLLKQATTFLSDFIVIILGYKIIKRQPKWNIIFWCSYLAIILNNIRGGIEMYARFYNWVVIFLPFMYGLIIINLKSLTKSQLIRVAIIAILLIQFGYYGIIRSIGSIGYSGCAFVWDL